MPINDDESSADYVRPQSQQGVEDNCAIAARTLPLFSNEPRLVLVPAGPLPRIRCVLLPDNNWPVVPENWVERTGTPHDENIEHARSKGPELNLGIFIEIRAQPSDQQSVQHPHAPKTAEAAAL